MKETTAALTTPVKDPPEEEYCQTPHTIVEDNDLERYLRFPVENNLCYNYVHLDASKVLDIAENIKYEESGNNSPLLGRRRLESSPVILQPWCSDADTGQTLLHNNDVDVNSSASCCCPDMLRFRSKSVDEILFSHARNTFSSYNEKERRN